MKCEISERLPLVSLVRSHHYIWFGILPNHTNGSRNTHRDKRVNGRVPCTANVSRPVEPALWGKNNLIIQEMNMAAKKAAAKKTAKKAAKKAAPKKAAKKKAPAKKKAAKK
jgi:hypothetical protein